MTAILKLAKNQDKRLRGGHLWVYSNEVDNVATPLKSFEPGQPVAFESAEGKWLGFGYVNPNSLICGRLLSRDKRFQADQSLLVHRIKIALGLREARYAQPYYRLLFGEGDALPGVVVDRYGEHLSVQITTAGMESMKDALIAALDKVLRPASITLRNDSPVREQEGLPRYIESAKGKAPELVGLQEGESRFEVSLTEGQKTGWFYDQAANRDRLRPYVQGKRVLDVCSYVGGWGIRAAAMGASEVACVDVSSSALDQVEHNAALNGLQDKVATVQGDALKALKALKAAGDRWDVIVLDPPAFIKRKKDMKEGALAYRRLNEAAMSLLGKDGLLVSASCSFHMDRDNLLRTVQQAARHADRNLQLLESGQQGPDHPIHPAIPETAYLKAFYLRVLPTL
jgi:23S rRNA (cytosine1962-C5)-methyltransferase